MAVLLAFKINCLWLLITWLLVKYKRDFVLLTLLLPMDMKRLSEGDVVWIEQTINS